MGMFNYVYCDYKLRGPMPNQRHPENAFQTKSLFDRNMDTYYISENGGLYKRDFFDDVLDEDRGYEQPRIEWMRNNLNKMNKVIVTGAIDMYSEIKGRWVEYVICFEGGKLVGSHLVRYGDDMLWKHYT